MKAAHDSGVGIPPAPGLVPNPNFRPSEEGTYACTCQTYPHRSWCGPWLLPAAVRNAGVAVPAAPLEMSRDEADEMIRAADGHAKMSEVRELVQEAFRRGVAAARGVMVDATDRPATPEEQRIYDSIADRYQRERTAGVRVPVVVDGRTEEEWCQEACRIGAYDCVEVVEGVRGRWIRTFTGERTPEKITQSIQALKAQAERYDRTHGVPGTFDGLSEHDRNVLGVALYKLENDELAAGSTRDRAKALRVAVAAGVSVPRRQTD